MIAHFNIIDGKPTLWDTPQTNPPSKPLRVIVHNGEVVAAFSPQTHADLKQLLNYVWVDEERSFEEDEDALPHIFQTITRLSDVCA